MELEINKIENGSEITFELAGQLNTATSPKFEKELNEANEKYDSMIIDCRKLEYISSVGLRLLLVANDAMKDKGGLTIKGVNDFIFEILYDVGFIDFFNVEKA